MAIRHQLECLLKFALRFFNVALLGINLAKKKVSGIRSGEIFNLSAKYVLGTIKVVRNCLFAKSRDPIGLIVDMVKYAEVARRDGILALENVTASTLGNSSAVTTDTQLPC